MSPARVIALAAVLALAITGCASAVAPSAPSGAAASSPANSGPAAPSPTPPSSPVGPPSGINDGASPPPEWAAFPVSAQPRPIVLLGEAVLGPASGFRSGDDKLAFLAGQVRVSVALPAGPKTDAGYPLDPAAESAAQLMIHAPAGVQTATILSVVSAGLIRYAFPTDRGIQQLPAWAFHLDGVTDDVYVLAVAASARYPATPQHIFGAAPIHLGADGRSLTMYYADRHSPSGPCDLGYTSSLSVRESSTSVVLAVTIKDDPPTGSSTYACPAIGLAPPTQPPTPGAPGTRTISLAQPLGARVVVDGTAVPYVVTA